MFNRREEAPPTERSAESLVGYRIEAADGKRFTIKGIRVEEGVTKLIVQPDAGLRRPLTFTLAGPEGEANEEIGVRLTLDQVIGQLEARGFAVVWSK